MDYTKDEIILFDRILNFCIKQKQGNCSCNLFIQSYKIERLKAEFAYNQMCKIGHELGFFISMHFGNGDWGIVSIDYAGAEQFKKNGGFAEYFKLK